MPPISGNKKQAAPEATEKSQDTSGAKGQENYWISQQKSGDAPASLDPS